MLYTIIIILMNNFQEDDFHIWRIKLEMAKQGSSQAIEEIKSYLQPHIDSDHLFATADYAHILKEASAHLINKDQTYGSYEVYTKVPVFALLQGKAAIQCINTQGDNETICSVAKVGLLQLNQTELKIKYGQSNITLITQFQVIAQEKSIVIEIPQKSIQAAVITSEQTTLREEAIMRKYMLIALKHITKLIYTKAKPVTNKFYLLQGRVCYINKKNNHMLCCYEQGYFDPAHLTNYSLYIFEGAYLMLLEQEMIKDEVVTGLEVKRIEHLDNIQRKYDKISSEQRQKMQQLLIEKFALNRQQVQKQIFCIDKSVQKFMKSKNDFIRTSSSMKDKCGIRIRKAKKTN